MWRGPPLNPELRTLDACGSGELPLLEALPAEDRTSLRRAEGDGGLLAASRAVGRGFDPLASDHVFAAYELGAGDARFALQLLQRLGSFLKFLSAKNSCSPAVQRNSVPQSTQLRFLSWNSIALPLDELVACPRTTGPVKKGTRPSRPAPFSRSSQLVRLAALLLARTLSRQRLFGTAPIARLQIVRMLLDILDDIFLLYFAFEATERAFNRFAFLNLDFSQA